MVKPAKISKTVPKTEAERTAAAAAVKMSTRLCENCGKAIAADKISVVKRVVPIGSGARSQTLTIYTHRGACPKS